MNVTQDINASELLLHTAMNSTTVSPQSYFSYPQNSSLLAVHIAITSLAWIFILPIGVVLSIARSKIALPTHLIFTAANTIGILLGIIYCSKTPDLYENNAHSKIGWIATWISVIYTVLGFIVPHTRAGRTRQTQTLQVYQRLQDLHVEDSYRYSRDSGHGTDSTSPRPSSLEYKDEGDPAAAHSFNVPNYDSSDVDDTQQSRLLGNKVHDQFISRKLSWIATSRASSLIGALHSLLERTILLLGFIVLATGIVTYGGIFRDNHIFNGLAHFVKGAIFFWYGLFSLARCMGAFADLGWAWNIKPPADIVGARKAAMPSAEFVESFLIFIYGSSNVFLEHLASWGGAWSAQDLEHVSITIMFFGGGLCGMLLESRGIRDLLNATFLSHSRNRGNASSFESWRVPKTYGISMNPLPGLIIFLLGILMSSHHQASMVSTMIHKQWGSLFVGAAFARGVTYILTYLSPPTSFLPSRPPSELIVAFCLISGGLIFMSSNRDTVAAMEAYDLNAMFIFTVMMGLTAFLMAWTIVVLAVKGWAVRHSQRRSEELDDLDND